MIENIDWAQVWAGVTVVGSALAGLGVWHKNKQSQEEKKDKEDVKPVVSPNNSPENQIIISFGEIIKQLREENERKSKTIQRLDEENNRLWGNISKLQEEIIELRRRVANVEKYAYTNRSTSEDSAREQGRVLRGAVDSAST